MLFFSFSICCVEGWGISLIRELPVKRHPFPFLGLDRNLLRLIYDPFAAVLCGDDSPEFPLQEDRIDIVSFLGIQ